MFCFVAIIIIPFCAKASSFVAAKPLLSTFLVDVILSDSLRSDEAKQKAVVNAILVHMGLLKVLNMLLQNRKF